MRQNILQIDWQLLNFNSMRWLCLVASNFWESWRVFRSLWQELKGVCGLLCALAGPYVVSSLISFVLTVLSVELFKQLLGHKEKFGSWIVHTKLMWDRDFIEVSKTITPKKYSISRTNYYVSIKRTRSFSWHKCLREDKEPMILMKSAHVKKSQIEQLYKNVGRLVGQFGFIKPVQYNLQ